jgi:hypothetical protein
VDHHIRFCLGGRSSFIRIKIGDQPQLSARFAPVRPVDRMIEL